MMLIGQLAKKAGLSRDTIRFYEKQGLIAPGVQDSPFNNYKRYPAQSLEKLLLIKKLKGFGFTLKEISSFLDLLDRNVATCKNVEHQFSDKISLIDAKIKALQEMRALMIRGLASCPRTTEETGNCPMITMD